MRVLLEPQFNGEDKKGDGGIRRVIEAQKKYLGEYGIELVSSEEQADLVALHAGTHVKTLKPVVTHCHGLYWKDYDWPNWARQVNLDVAVNIRRADVVTVPSKWVAESLKYAFWIDPVIVGHGIDAEEWPAGRHDGYVLWNKTRVDKVCTVEEVETLARMARSTKFVSSFGQGPNITNVGRQSYEQAKQTLSGASVYLATAKETFGIGILEAMACGIPVLGWNWGGAAEVVRHKQDGYLANPGDYDDLLQGLIYCLGHTEELGAEARRYVAESWNWEPRIAQYAELYKQVESAGSAHPIRVSVVIPCYNLSRYLREAVESCVEEADEVIILDDASTDDTIKVADELRREYKKVRLYGHGENQGVAATLNDLVEAAKGDYIVPLDADNMMAPGALTVLRKALDDDKTIDIAYGAMQCIDVSGEPLSKYGPNGVSNWPPKFKYEGPYTFPRSYCPSTSMYRRRVWEVSGGYRLRYQGVEDADFWTRATSLGFLPKKVTEAVSFQYRIRDDSLSHTNKPVDWTHWYPKQPPVFSTPMRDTPTVSIIVPVGRGHETVLQDALDSVWMQTFEQWECIVVNDTDELLRVPSWIRVLETDGKVGPAAARNLGIHVAKGKYVYFLDADDYMQPKTLELLIQAVGLGKRYAYGDWIDQDGNVYTTPDCACKDLAAKCPIPVSILYPKTVDIRFDENLQQWEDWDFLLSLETAGYTGVRVDKPLLRYRLNKGLRRRSADPASVLEIKEKWGEINLACGACGQPRSVMLASSQPPLDGNWVLMDYVSPQQGTRTYRAPSNTIYRFGTDSSHRTKRVRQEDVNYLLSLGVFQLHEDLVPA